MFWGTRATNFSIYTTKMEGAGPKILRTGAKFKQVPCQKDCRVNRAFITCRHRLLTSGPLLVMISTFRSNIMANNATCSQNTYFDQFGVEIELFSQHTISESKQIANLYK